MDYNQQVDVLRLGTPEQVSLERVHCVDKAADNVLRVTASVETVVDTSRAAAAVIAEAERIVSDEAAVMEAERIVADEAVVAEAETVATDQASHIAEAHSKIAAAYANNPLFKD